MAYLVPRKSARFHELPHSIGEPVVRPSKDLGVTLQVRSTRAIFDENKVNGEVEIAHQAIENDFELRVIPSTGMAYRHLACRLLKP